MSRLRAGIAAAAMVVVGAAACDETTDPTLLNIDDTGVVRGILFLDLNGSGQLEFNADEPVEGRQIVLRQPAGGVLGTTVTDTSGFFRFADVPVGGVQIEVPGSLLGDTLELFGVALEPVTLPVADSVVLRPGVRFRTYTLAEVRALAPGIPVFTHGVALNTVGGGVRDLHIKTDAGFLRVTGILSGLAFPGDSVRVRGRTAVLAGQPFLSDGAVFNLGPTGRTPEAVLLSTAQADDAQGGTLDAALVQVENARVVEVEEQLDDAIRVVVNDGSGEVELLLRPFLGLTPSAFIPDTTIVERARGVLVPYSDGGDTRWQVQPRARSDLRTVLRP